MLAAAPASAIVNGTAARDGAHAFMASVQEADGFAFCGGTVIAPRWVLTAAHCVEGAESTPLFVVTGRTDLDDTRRGQRIAVDRRLVHPKRTPSSYDVALLHLAAPTRAPSIRLAGSAEDRLERPGTTLTVAGWGDQTPTYGINSSSSLRQTDLQVVSDAECGQTNLDFDAATGVCASALLRDSCQGDSGGPLFAAAGARSVQVGVVSYGQGCALPKFPGVYSEVNNPQIRGWITSVTRV